MTGYQMVYSARATGDRVREAGQEPGMDRMMEEL
jgi:hypothetical protein